MAVEVNLETIIEALELADDSISSFLDVEAGEVHSKRSNFDRSLCNGAKNGVVFRQTQP